MSRMTDDDIIGRLFRRDESALHVVQGVYGKLCYKLADDILGCREDSEECVNDMLMRLWNSIPPNHPQNLEAYIVTMIRHLALDKYHVINAKKRGGKQFEAALEEIGDTLKSDEDMDDAVNQWELTKAIEQFLYSLPERTRNIFLRRYYMSESIKEIAERYDMSVSATKISLMRTRDKLQKYLRKEDLL